MMQPDPSTTKVKLIKLKNSSSRGISFRYHKLDVSGPPSVDKVTCEVLSRLPLKSLMRFKCVCKCWGMLVEKDPYFIELYGTHLKAHPNFFAVIKKPVDHQLFTLFDYRAKLRGTDPYKDFKRDVYLVTAEYLYNEECESIADIHGISEVKVPFHVHFFGPLNGLLGFHDYKHYCGIRLVNLYTQHITPWMKSASARKYEELEDEIKRQYTSCQLGFDPTTKEHKVICLRSLKHGLYLSFCEVFTVGGDEWRKIDDVPFNFVDVYKHSIYLNGSIYYSPLSFTQRGIRYDKIVVFDVGPEKFRTITVPDFIVDHRREIHTTVSRPVDLLEVDGQLALLCRINGSIVKLWLYDDVDDECKRKNCWEEVTIELPFIWDEKLILTFLSDTGENQIILKSGRYNSYKVDKINNLSYLIYNLTTKTFTKMGIRGIPYPSFLSTSMCDKTYMNSLWSVQ